ncbi:MAG: hypothetical protein LUH00_02235 [Lachnospiraceae bacterium]|nr:hypothetical protein [Lachnospiraceae bacterium]
MKGEQVRNLFKQTSVKVTGAVLAAAIAVGSIWAVNYQSTNVPELVSFVDTEEVVNVSEEEVPLSNKQVTTSTKTTKSTKKVKLDTAATSTYSVKGKTTTSTSTKTSTTASSKTTTKTTVKTTVTNKYTEGSKVCKQVTTEKTTIKKTVVTTSASTTSATTASSSTDTASTTSTTTAKTIEALAPKVDSKVVTAWNTLGFSFVLDSSVSYSGYFNAMTQSITLKSADDTVYHELGHFVAFVAGGVDTSSSFESVYNSEKDLYTAYNKSYVTQDSSEYFAESFKEYTLDPATLKASRPQTYAAIEAAVAKLTTAQITKIKTVYASVWS